MVSSTLSRVKKTISNPHFWALLLMSAIGLILHYPQQILSSDLPSLFSFLGLTRHSIERIFLLLPISYAGFFFGVKVGLAYVVVAFLIMLPRVLYISVSKSDAILETCGIVIIGILVNLAFERYRRERERRQEMLSKIKTAHRQLVRAQEEERKRIARELHDDTAQELLVISRWLDLTSAEDYFPKKLGSFVEELRQKIANVLDGVRRFSQDLRPSILDDLGLIPSLEWLTADLSQTFGVDIAMAVFGKLRRFPPEVELTLFRITQEALRNVCKHSEASKAWINVEFGATATALTIRDNGKGFHFSERIEDLASTGKLGLIGMQERALLIEGKLTIRSKPGKGTTVIIEIPN